MLNADDEEVTNSEAVVSGSRADVVDSKVESE